MADTDVNLQVDTELTGQSAELRAHARGVRVADKHETGPRCRAESNRANKKIETLVSLQRAHRENVLSQRRDSRLEKICINPQVRDSRIEAIVTPDEALRVLRVGEDDAGRPHVSSVEP